MKTASIRGEIMEFNEKLQGLRKSKGLTQEELAEILYVSRTAVSKWESGRGLPNIDSLKEISKFFSVSIDDLLSGEKILSLAEKENKSNIRNICDLLFGVTDLFSFILIVLPLYPNTVNGHIYSVNLSSYTETSSINLFFYWTVFIMLILLGFCKLILTKMKNERLNKVLTVASLSINISAVLLLAVTREVYALIVVFLMFTAKTILILKYRKNDLN